MLSSIKSVLTQYATFSGRASRAELWWWVLAVVILLAFTRIIDGAFVAPMLGFERFEVNAGQPLSLICSLLLILPNLAVSVRRLHDLNKSGWMILIGLIPLIGTLVLLYFYVQPGDEGDNNHGAPNPLTS